MRRSVANNLNDISKDHPELVAHIAGEWMILASDERKKLVRHACRSLIKGGNKKALQVFGYGPPEIGEAVIKVTTPELELGNNLEIILSLTSNSSSEQALLIDYAIHHQKANGKTSAKVFKWRTKNLAANEVFVSTKKHAIKKITTRVYYPGKHVVEVLVNGVSVGAANFDLVMP